MIRLLPSKILLEIDHFWCAQRISKFQSPASLLLLTNLWSGDLFSNRADSKITLFYCYLGTGFQIPCGHWILTGKCAI